MLFSLEDYTRSVDKERLAITTCAACLFGMMIVMMVKVFIPQMIVHPADNQWIKLEMKYPLPHSGLSCSQHLPAQASSDAKTVPYCCRQYNVHF